MSPADTRRHVQTQSLYATTRKKAFDTEDDEAVKDFRRRFARRRLVVERRTDAAGHRRADNRSPPFSASLAHEDDMELTPTGNWRNPAEQSPRLSTASACHQRRKRATRLTVPCSKLSCVVPLTKVGASQLTPDVAALAGRRARPPRQGPPAPGTRGPGALVRPWALQQRGRSLGGAQSRCRSRGAGGRGDLPQEQAVLGRALLSVSLNVCGGAMHAGRSVTAPSAAPLVLQQAREPRDALQVAGRHRSAAQGTSRRKCTPSGGCAPKRPRLRLACSGLARFKHERGASAVSERRRRESRERAVNRALPTFPSHDSRSTLTRGPRARGSIPWQDRTHCIAKEREQR